MATLTRQGFLANQLKALAPNADWNAGGVDRLSELAAMFDRAEVLDLGKLTIIPVSWETENPGGWLETESSSTWIEPSVTRTDSYRFQYEGRGIGFMGTPDRPENEPGFQLHGRGYICAWSAEGRGHVGYVVRANPTRTGIEIVPVWDSSSDAASIRSALIMFASFVVMVALPIGGISIGANVGAAIFGQSFAAAYPLVTAAVGNAAVATVLNGGDVKAAAKSAALGAIGGGVGSAAGAQVAQMTTSPLFGALAQSVTSAAIQGGDLKSAAISTLVTNGVKMWTTANDDFTPGLADLMLTGEWQPLPDLPVGEWDGSVLLPIPEVPEMPDQWGGDSWAFDPPSGGDGWEYPDLSIPPIEYEPLPDLPPVGETWWVEPNAIPSVPSMPIPGVPYSPQSNAYTPTQIVGTVTQAMMAALQLVQAYRALSAPTVQPVARNVSSNGTVSVIGNNGLVQSRTPQGTITYTKPPIGIPQATIDGGFVVNNGNGTYTAISASGASSTQSYPATSAGGGVFGSIPPALLIGGGVAALLLLSKRSR